MTVLQVFAGDPVYASDLNNRPQGLIAQYSRKTSSTVNSTTTEVGYFRLDNIAVRAGYSYEVTWVRPIPSYATSASSAVMRLRGSQSGNATPASTKLKGGESRVLTPANTSNGAEQPCMGIWECTVSGTLSVIATFQRADGTGTATQFASTGDEQPCIVKEIGLTQTNSGTDL